MKGLAFLLFVLAAGCSSSKILSSWTAPEAGSNSYQKILVASILSNEDSLLRRQMESHVVGDLQALGYKAVSFHQQFDANDFRSIRYDSARALFQREGIDGVITVSLLAKEKQSVYVPDKPPLPAEPPQRTDFWDYYTRVREAIGRPGYYVNSTELFWESNFYDLSSLALLYHVHSKSFDPSSTQKLAHEYGKLIVDDLQKRSVLTAKKLSE
ncbi:hypothetical protein [Flavisolibacter nicotianae]|uniref:hypothetical protein n=1 Tax=Flavisolibacter nicotianae TaxID=2364882 RepID=UPI000EAFB2AB|nr:hypothetical protein [Flavisolibacter nicotianae]